MHFLNIRYISPRLKNNYWLIMDQFKVLENINLNDFLGFTKYNVRLNGEQFDRNNVLKTIRETVQGMNCSAGGWTQNGRRIKRKDTLKHLLDLFLIIHSYSYFKILKKIIF